MSRLIEIDLECPSCGFGIEWPVYTSANVTLDPELRDMIFSDELNRFICSECGDVSIAGVSLMYHDMLRKFAVWFCPQGPIPEEYVKKLEDLAHRKEHMTYLAMADQTFTWEEFKEAIRDKESETAGLEGRF